MKHLLKIFLFVALGVTLVMPAVHADNQRSAARSINKSINNRYAQGPKAKSVVFAISKMHCEGCANGLVQAAKAWPGVKSAAVSFAQRRALVTFDTSKTSAAKIAREFTRLGFPAKVLR